MSIIIIVNVYYTIFTLIKKVKFNFKNVMFYLKKGQVSFKKVKIYIKKIYSFNYIELAL